MSSETKFCHSKNYYHILGIEPTSNDTEIKDNFMALCKKFHPDNKLSGDAERFILVKEAYDVIKDPERRALYDRFCGQTRYKFDYNRDNKDSIYRQRSQQTKQAPTMDEQWAHIHRVHERLNRDEERLYDAKFRRRWAEDNRAWMYNRRNMAYTQRNRRIYTPRFVVLGCFFTIGLGIALNLINYNIYLKRIANQSIRKSHAIALETDTRRRTPPTFSDRDDSTSKSPPP